MIERLVFVYSYAIRNMIRDRRRTAFTLLSVAAGVATVVALRMLGLMLTDALTSNAQAFLRGDIKVVTRSSDRITVSIFETGDVTYAFSAANMAHIRDWAADNDVEVTFVSGSELMQTAVIADGQAGAPALAMSYFIEPGVYPFYDIVRAEDPPGVLLADLFSGPDPIVLGRRLADQIGAEVGDQVRIGAAENFHTVTGIVADSAESSFESPNSLLFSFVYLDRTQMTAFGLEDVADRAYIRLPEPTPEAVERIAQGARRWPDSDMGRNVRWSIDTADEILEINTVIADVISRFVLVLSLVGLVIGGVGIINTMLVAVNRRSMEIAILKTLGLQGRDVSLVFMAEATIAGLVGSLLGIVLGILLSYFARDLGQQAFAVPLPWRIYLDPMLIGVALGMVITVFFSFLPTTIAARIRPNLVLRAGSIPMARAGCLWSLLSLVLMIVGFGLLVDLILGTHRFPFIQLPPPLTPGITGTLGVFIMLGIFLALTWVLVWVLGKLPTFRNPNLQIAIKGLTIHRSRTALSLLALIIGMTSLSGTLIMTRSINMLLFTSISQPLGGNIIILPLPLVKPLVHARLDAQEAVNGYRDLRFPTNVRLQAIDGERDFEDWFDLSDENFNSGLRFAQLQFMLGVEVHGEPPRGTLVAGRYLGPEDAGQPHITIPHIPELEANGVGVGSTLTYRLARQTIDFEVVGIVAPDANASFIPFSLGDSAPQIPLDMVSSDIPIDFIIADAETDAIKDVMASVGAVPGLFVFDISIFDSMISRLLNQMAALPLLVAGLSLFAATTLIATTVALATLESRRQIAMLKALGVNRWQTLGQLLAENGIVGLAGGLISLLPTALILWLVPALTQGIVHLPTPVDLIALMLALSVIITLLATLLTAWSASGETPLTVLRQG